MNVRKDFRVIESNEAAGTMRYIGEPFATIEAADTYARARIGDATRKRRFYVLLVEHDGGRLELYRGLA